MAYHYDSKQRIAQKAVESIQNGETVMIESGSCCALVALEIAQTKKDVTLITNSAFIADYIRKIGTVKIILWLPFSYVLLIILIFLNVFYSFYHSFLLLE